MKKLALISFLFLSGCIDMTVDGTSTSTTSTNTTGTLSSETGTTEESTTTEGELQSSDPGLAVEPDVQESCPDKWCATSSWFCDCGCAPVWPYYGSAVCCNSATNGQPLGGSCGPGKVVHGCKRLKEVSEDPMYVPPSQCDGMGYVCPAGYSPTPSNPAEGGCASATCSGSCQGSAESCALNC